MLGRRPTAFSAVASEVVPNSSTVATLSGHRDALRRRKQHEEWRRQRMVERDNEKRLMAAGLRWYEGPTPDNMVMCASSLDYKELLARATSEGRLLVAKFFTSDCWVCKSIHPKIKQIAAEHPDVLWAKLNGSDPELVDLFHTLGVTKVPLFHFVRDGELVSELSASLSPEKLSLFRAELAAHRPVVRAEAPAQAS